MVPSLTSFCRSRAWSKGEIDKIQRVANYAVRRAFGMDRFIMQEHHVRDKQMYKAAGWDPMITYIQRQSLIWLGHIARMHVDRLPKVALFGWWQGQEGRRTCRIAHPKYFSNCLGQAGIPELDWFRIAQHRKDWRGLVQKAYPKIKLSKKHLMDVNKWRPGQDLPTNMAEIIVSNAPTSNVSNNKCPVCDKTCKNSHELYFHYRESHSVRDPDVVTVTSTKCEQCKQFFATKNALIRHVCPARKYRREMALRETGNFISTTIGPQPSPPRGWWIATDGSGQNVKSEMGIVSIAGWGAVVWRWPIVSGPPDFVLHAPVIVEPWHPMWMGAREQTNNTGELSAIGESMMWLLSSAPDNGTLPVTIRYDSEYAANVAQGRWKPKANQELAAKVVQLTNEVTEKRVISWIHVYGHSGEHDNEIADEAADLGAKGKVSLDHRRWYEPAQASSSSQVILPEICKKCGKEYDAAEIQKHMESCKHTPNFCPPEHEVCRKCKYVLWAPRLDYRTQHEKQCRGSKEANSTCAKCGETGWPLGARGSSKPLGNHERKCKGTPRPQKDIDASRANWADAERRANAKAKAKGKAKAKALPASARVNRAKLRANLRATKVKKAAAKKGTSMAKVRKMMQKAREVKRKSDTWGKRARYV